MKWYLYILLCSDKSLYTGITNNLDRRVSMHNAKIGAKYVRGKLPVKMVYNETFETQAEAAKREYEIKGWKRAKKLDLVEKNRVHPEEQGDEGPVAQR